MEAMKKASHSRIFIMYRLNGLDFPGRSSATVLSMNAANRRFCRRDVVVRVDARVLV